MTILQGNPPATTEAVRGLAFVLANIYPLECPRTETSSLDKMRTMVKRWGKVIGDIPLAEIDRAKVLEFRNAALAAGLAAETVNSNVRVILTLIRIGGHKIDGMRLKIQERNQVHPTPTIDGLNRVWRITESAQWPVTHKQNGRAVWTSIAPGMWWRAVLMLAFSTGLRRADLFGLRWSEIEADRIPTINRKTKKPQYLPIPDPLRPWLELLRKNGDETVLGKGSGRQQQIDRELRHFGHLCEIKDLGLQALRRAAARAYETAHPGCGRLILNHGATVTERYYLDMFETLQHASTKLIYPEAFLTPPGELLQPTTTMPPASRLASPSNIIRPVPAPAIQAAPELALSASSPWDFL